MANKAITQKEWGEIVKKLWEQAFKEALEQPAYETESWKNNMKEAEEILAKAKFANEQHAQEPVAYCDINNWEFETPANYYHGEANGYIPLYTHPAPSWVGLSDDEIREIDDLTLGAEYFEEQATEFARAIEQALKEKNL